MNRSPLYHYITKGRVVDANDPQQAGRLRVVCARLGDRLDSPVKHIPWAEYMSPFGGITTYLSRGPVPEGTTVPEGTAPEAAAKKTCGPVAYGMWAIPKVGAEVFLMCIDGNPSQRVWIGCKITDNLAHTMPHGRFLVGGRRGPDSSTEQAIEPFASTVANAFDGQPLSNEWRTRVADNQVAGISKEVLDQTVSKEIDEKDGTDRQGYQTDRVNPDLKFPDTDGNFDSQVYSLTTPGFHSFAMDDSLKNGRVRIRTTTGHQLIFDDTNERIYISTSEGNNWVELDNNGNIDVYSARRVSIHAEKDINLTANDTVRISAKNVHVRATEDIRMKSDGDTRIIGNNVAIHGLKELALDAEEKLSFYSSAVLSIYSNSTLNIEAIAAVYVKSTSLLSLKSSAATFIEGSAVVNVFSGGLIAISGGSTAIQAGAVAAPDPLPSDIARNILADEDGKHPFTVNRVPLHEPWGRIMLSTSNTDNSKKTNVLSTILAIDRNYSVLSTAEDANKDPFELFYNDNDVGKLELGETIRRNRNWRR